MKDMHVWYCQESFENSSGKAITIILLNRQGIIQFSKLVSLDLRIRTVLRLHWKNFLLQFKHTHTHTISQSAEASIHGAQPIIENLNHRISTKAQGSLQKRKYKGTKKRGLTQTVSSERDRSTTLMNSQWL